MESVMRILTVGGSLPGVEHNSREWTSQVNIKDYDAVFLNLDKIVALSEEIPGPMSEVPHRVRFPLQEDVKKCLKAGNNIFVFLPRTRQPELLTVTEERTTKDEVDLLSWLPFKFTTTEEAGTSVNQDSVPHSWDWYFDTDFDWPMYIERVKLEESFKQNWLDNVRQNTIASTTFEEDIACQLNITAILDAAVALSQNSEINDPTYPGSVFLIPIRPKWEFEDIVRGILSKLYGWSIDVEQTQEPDWIEHYRLSKQVELASRIKELQQEYSDLQEFRRLLYADDDELENAVLQAFDYLGFNTEGELSGQRDGLIHANESVIALEIGGTSNKISLRKCRQLNNWVEDIQEEYQDKQVHGLLVANAHRKTPPSERDSSVVGNPQEFLKQRGYKVLETPVLYLMLDEYQSGSLSKSNIESVLLNDDLFITIA